MRKKTEDSFHFHYKDNCKEIELSTPSKSAGKACKLLERIVHPACQSQEKKAESVITLVTNLLTIAYYLYKIIRNIIGLVMHIYFQEDQWITGRQNYLEYQV